MLAIMQHVDTALLIFNLGALVGIYVWVFRNVEAVKAMLNEHKQDASKHVDASELVHVNVCAERVKRFEERIERVEKSIDKGFGEVKELIREKHAS